MFIYNIHHLHAVTTNRIKVPRALRPATPVASMRHLPITLAGHSTQRIKAPLLFANDVPGKFAALPSDGILHTVVISICKGWGRGKRNFANVQEMMSSFPSCIKNFFAFHNLFLFLLRILPVYDVGIDMGSIHDSMRSVEWPTFGLAEAGSDGTHLIEGIGPFFSEVMELNDFRFASAANGELSVLR